jgi:hypothetical protein
LGKLEAMIFDSEPALKGAGLSLGAMLDVLSEREKKKWRKFKTQIGANEVSRRG